MSTPIDDGGLELRWLTNAPRVADCQEDDAYRRDKIIGPPKATESYSVEELQGMGMVGIYLPESMFADAMLAARKEKP